MDFHPNPPVTGTGTNRGVVVPSPNCPYALLPQQSKPCDTIAQLCKRPTATWDTFAGIVTATGRTELLRLPTPSWPSELSPQHHNVNPPVAQVWFPPPSTTLHELGSNGGAATATG
jgi:hypothetical protein